MSFELSSNWLPRRYSQNLFQELTEQVRWFKRWDPNYLYSQFGDENSTSLLNPSICWKRGSKICNREGKQIKVEKSAAQKLRKIRNRLCREIDLYFPVMTVWYFEEGKVKLKKVNFSYLLLLGGSRKIKINEKILRLKSGDILELDSKVEILGSSSNEGTILILF